MIVDNGKYYLYRHLRNDTGNPFYIGIGKKSGNTYDRMYRRANSWNYRNRIWLSIANKSGFFSEILAESNDSDFIKKKESEFISLYGRIDLKNGVLCNLTTGGDGDMERSKQSIALQLKTSKTNGTLDIAIERVREFRFKSGVATRNKAVYLYSINGDYIQSFSSMTHCALHIGCSVASISVCLKNLKHYNCFLFSKIKVSKLNIGKYILSSQKEKPVCMINPIDLSVIGCYNSLVDAEKITKIHNRNISRSLKLRCKTKGNFWIYEKEVSKILYLKNKKIGWR